MGYPYKREYLAPYYVKEKAPFETFFQIDLGRVMENGDKAEIALFAHFFNVQSFVLDKKGKCCLETYRQESDEATKQIEEHLQGKMEDILGKICMGFIQSEGKKFYSEEEKRNVFNNSIYLLYRLLFILYAEARGFLKLLFPNLQPSREDFINHCLKPAVELRQRVRDELHKMDPEYPQVSIGVAT